MNVIVPGGTQLGNLIGFSVQYGALHPGFSRFRRKAPRAFVDWRGKICRRSTRGQALWRKEGKKARRDERDAQ